MIAIIIFNCTSNEKLSIFRNSGQINVIKIRLLSERNHRKIVKFSELVIASSHTLLTANKMQLFLVFGSMDFVFIEIELRKLQ